jgi:hypothetical protein
LRLNGTILLLVLIPLASGCGYRPVYGGGIQERLHVKLVRTLVPDAIASDEVASGVREELARQGALDAGDGYPRVEIEVLRADEVSEGIRAGTGPLARATDVAIVGRAWVVRSPGAAPERDSGDMGAEEVISADVNEGALDPRASGFHHADALRAAGRRLGSKLARRVTGRPASSEDVSEGL